MRLRTSAVDVERSVRRVRMQPSRGRGKLTAAFGSESEGGEEESAGEIVHTQEDLSKREGEDPQESLSEF